MIAIQGGKIYTVSQVIINDGTILIKNRKIICIGNNIKISKNTEIINARTHYITPGFIDAHTLSKMAYGQIEV